MHKLLHLVRHGETSLSVRGAYSGSIDVPLTDEGLRQAEAAAEALRDRGVQLVLTSPFARARATAERIAAATGARLEVDERLVEVVYGPLDGLDRAEATERFGDAYLGWRARPFGGELPGMERLEAALRRARDATVAALERCDRPVLVSHQGTLRLVLIALGRVERDAYFGVQIQTAEPIAVEVREPLPELTAPA